MDETWFEDQARAAADEAQQIVSATVATSEDRPGGHRAVVGPTRIARVLSLTGRTCGHITDAPTVICALARYPGFTYCVDCVPIDSIDAPCDGCNRGTGIRYVSTYGAWVFVVSLCEGCRRGEPLALSGASPWSGANRAERRAAARASRKNGA